MKSKSILNKFYSLLSIFILAILALVAVIGGEQEEIINNYFTINWLVGFGLFLLGLKEMANPIRLGFGTTRRSIYLQFMKRLFLIIVVFIIVWASLLIILSLKAKQLIFNLNLLNDIIWLISSTFILAQVGLLLGVLRIKNLIPFVVGILLFIVLFQIRKNTSFISSGIIISLGLAIMFVTYRVIRNIKILEFINK